MKKTIVMTFAVLLAFQVLAFAEWIEGTVVSVNNSNSILTIQRADTDLPKEAGDATTNANVNTSIPDQLELQVKKDATFKNIVSLDQLKPGSQVKINVRNNPDMNTWEAMNIELKRVPNETPMGATY